MSAFLPSALRRISARVVMLQLFGNAVLLACAFAWLEVPDSHIWELVLSLLLGAVILSAFFGLHATTIRSLRQPADPQRVRIGAPVLACWMLLLYLPSIPVNYLDARSPMIAGYLNSKLSAPLRTTFTYDRLSNWQSAALDILFWYLIPTLLLPFILETVSRRISRDTVSNALATLRRWQHWLTVIPATGASFYLWNKIVDWHPSYTVRGELISSVLRIGLLYLLDLLLFFFVLSIVSELLARNDARRNPAA